MFEPSSSYVVDIPLGLGGCLEFRFLRDAKGEISVAESVLVDSRGEESTVPSALTPLADEYMKSWLAVKSAFTPGLYEPQGWVDRGYWEETTHWRLGELVDSGHVSEEILDG